MKFHSKLYLSFIGIAVASSILGLSIIYIEYDKVVIEDFRAKLMAAAATTSALIDGNLHEQIQTEKERHSDAYHVIQKELQRVRSNNRKGALDIAYIYTLMPDPKNPNLLVYGVDSEENPKDLYQVGYPYEDADANEILHRLNNYWSSKDFTFDRWGAWISAFAPIKNKDGKTVATLAIYLKSNAIFTELAKVQRSGLIALIGSALLAALAATILSKMAGTSLSLLYDSVKKIGEGHLDTVVKMHTNDEFNRLGLEINQMTRGLQERERLKKGFARYVSQHILEKILSSKTALKLEGERKKITVLFTDIRQFSHLAEMLPPEDVVAILNRYLEKMIQVIFEHQGTLDKFFGDGIMVEFGAPLDDLQQEKNAITTALKMQEEMLELQKTWISAGKPLIEMGIGIHTGFAIVGNIGSEMRIEYTAIGDTVNVAARLEQSTKTLNAPILVSETTYNAVKDQFHFESLGSLPLYGRAEKVQVYSVSFLPEPKNNPSHPI